ncbi:MAG: hypothetical protein KAX70_00910 [Pseudomonas sp.]|nr:hypothetical protein [Pseudomonas sp.]
MSRFSALASLLAASAFNSRQSPAANAKPATCMPHSSTLRTAPANNRLSR